MAKDHLMETDRLYKKCWADLELEELLDPGRDEVLDAV